MYHKLRPLLGIHKNTLQAIKMCHFIFDYEWHFVGVVMHLVPVETGMKIRQYTYLMHWLCHNSVASHVTKLWLYQGYLQFETATANCFLECIWPNQLFATFTECSAVFVLSILIEKFFISILANEKLLHSHAFLMKILSSECSFS